MKYKFVGSGFYPGLPAQDLSDADLTDWQKEQLQQAVEAGAYVPVIKASKKGDEQHET
jgi:hypothetical protein